jgi:hypothetical protein
VEKEWIRSYLNDHYLWYRDIVDVDAGAYSTPIDYYYALLVTTPTASGKPRDRFSSAFPTALLDAPQYWQGIRWNGPVDELRVSYVLDATPAALAGVHRGDKLVAINGVPVSSVPAQAASDALFPRDSTQASDLTLLDLDGGTRIVHLSPVVFNDVAVLRTEVLDRPDGKVGYIAFNSQVGHPGTDMLAAYYLLSDAGVSDLVLDIRYNPGGTLEVVSSVGSMIGGSNVADRVFATSAGNDKVQAILVDAGRPPVFTELFPPTSFTLNLSRVFLLTTDNTCSASEDLMNGLAPFIDVRIVGTTTCGKPYGEVIEENCGTTFIPIVFSVENALHQGGFIDGLPPDCEAADDLTHELGDPDEGLLAAALAYRSSGICPPAARVPTEPSRSSWTSAGPYSRARFSPK